MTDSSSPPMGSFYEPTLNDMESSIGVRVFSFLTPRDASRLMFMSKNLQKICSEELLWRYYTLRYFPEISKSYKPEDECWISEFRYRSELKRRTVSYQKAQMMGMTGYRKVKELVRIKPRLRFAAFESSTGSTVRRRAAAELQMKNNSKDVSEIESKLMSMLQLSPGAQSTHDKIDAASSRPRDYIESRQGTATWAALSGKIVDVDS